MPAYWIARAKIDNPVEYKKYTDRIPPILKKYGAEPLARGGRYRVMEGPDRVNRYGAVEFPSFELAVECHGSPEYQAAAAFRRAPGVSEAGQVIVEAGDATPV